MEVKDYKNLLLIILAIFLLSSAIFIKKINERILDTEETMTASKEIYKTKEILLDTKRGNIEQLDYIEKYYPTNDVEKTLFSFLAYIVNEANIGKYELDSFLLDYSSLNEPGNLVDIKLKVKGYGGSLETGLFLHKIKKIKFSDVEGIKLEVDEDTGKTEGIIDLVITSKKTTYNSSIADPSTLSSIGDIKSNLAGNWVKFESVKEQLRMLREQGLTANSLLESGDGDHNIRSKNVEVELDGFEEIIDEPKSNSKVVKTDAKPVLNPNKPIPQAKGYSNPLKNVNILEKYTTDVPRLLLEAEKGTDVMAMDAGRIVFKGPLSGYGECIFIEHSNGETTLYAGLSSISVTVDQDILKGQSIAKTGIYDGNEGLTIGLTTKQGDFIDPTIYLK